MSRSLFTSESVTPGHPDKLCDQISDAVLDAFLTEDPHSRVACECLAGNGFVLVGGEVRSNADFIDIQSIVRRTIAQTGYTDPASGLDARSCAVLTTINEQSADIARGVSDAHKKVQGAGDQGLMFGYACDQTAEGLPLPIALAHRLSQQLTRVRVDGGLPWLRPDGKTQVTMIYEEGVPTALETVVLSAQHDPETSNEEISAEILARVIRPVVGEWLRPETRFFINPTGRFVTGGPQADCGLTGRKIMVDTYGGWARHGGGAFSGKDPSKVDRSGAYMARLLAKNVVLARWAKACEVQLSYAIGVAEPVGVRVQLEQPQKSAEEVEAFFRGKFDLTPQGIIDFLDLCRPMYQSTATFGHFGRTDLELPWEQDLGWA